MAEFPQELPDFNEVYDLYKGRHPEEPKDVPIERIDITDIKKFQSAINDFAEEISLKFKDTSEKDPRGQTRAYAEEQVTKTSIPLGEKEVEDSTNVSMEVYMNFANERGRKTQSVNFYFYKGEGEDKKFIGNVSVADRGEAGMEIIDRLVAPAFRGQGFGKTFMDCAEAFIKKTATERQQPVKSFASMSQLDVIYLFWKNGYRPETDEDKENLEMILVGHEALELVERLFVFKKGTLDTEKYFVKPTGEFALDDNGKRIVNYKNAFRIKMVKSIEGGNSKDVDGIIQEVKADKNEVIL